MSGLIIEFSGRIFKGMLAPKFDVYDLNFFM